MKEYIINTETGYILEDDGNLGASFRKEPYRLCTNEENEDQNLLEYKKRKIDQVKINRNNSNLEPVISVAYEIEVVDDSFSTTSNEVSFQFKVESTGQPATEPNSIILGVLIVSASNPDFYIRYSCEIIDGETTRKGYVAITATVAAMIQSQVQARNESNISAANSCEDSINDIVMDTDTDLDQAKSLIDQIDITIGL